MRTTSNRRKDQTSYEFVTGMSKKQKVTFGSLMLVAMLVMLGVMIYYFIELINLFTALERDIIPYIINIMIFSLLGVGLFFIVSLFTNTLGRKKKK